MVDDQRPEPLDQAEGQGRAGAVHLVQVSDSGVEAGQNRALTGSGGGV
ncbi:hypothetical protein [Streptomyces lacrimifluminis]|nr:hypothetical protein [Streptomyces lacrimifluminis]